MPQNDDITLGEVGRRLESLVTEVHGLGTKIDARPNAAYLDVVEQKHHAHHVRQDDAIKALQEGQAWIMRTAIVAMGTGVSGIVIALLTG